MSQLLYLSYYSTIICIYNRHGHRRIHMDVDPDNSHWLNTLPIFYH